MKRMVRRGVEAGVPILGVAIILGSVLLSPEINPQLHVTFLLVGVLILQAGPSGLTRLLLPSERVSADLREEGDHFLGLIRVLSRAGGTSEDGQEQDEPLRDTVEQMHTSVDRMAEIAG
jgi:hypothetical protein